MARQPFPMVPGKTKDTGMTDIAKPDIAPLDPSRPWITDPDDLPARMKWGAALLSPFGRLSKVHFTRAWTVLFFARIFVIVIPAFIGWVIGAAGGDVTGLKGLARIAVPVVLLVTVFFSYNLHIKRLADAGKSTLLAMLVFVPLIFAGTAFTFSALGASTQYEAAAAKRLYEIEHPEKARAEREAAMAAARAAEAEAEKGEGDEAGSGERRNRGERRGRGQSSGMDPDGEPLSKASIVLKAAQPAGQITLILLDFPLMLWTLLWVARLPKAGLRDDRQLQETA